MILLLGYSLLNKPDGKGVDTLRVFAIIRSSAIPVEDELNIGIVTILDNWDNYGSILQLVALRKYLLKKGHNVSFIRPPAYLDGIRYELEHYRSGYRIAPDADHLFLRKILKAYRITRQTICVPAKVTLKRLKYRKLIPMTSLADVSSLDLVIYGSDTLWDLTNRVFQDPFYWGCEIADHRIPCISYAVSADNTTSEQIEEKGWAVTYLPSFQSLSVRDEHSRQLLEPYHDAIEVVCDPTLLCPDELELKQINIQQPYLLIYCFDLSEKEISLITSFARAEGLLIVCGMGLRKYDFADLNLDCGFAGFSSLVSNASYVYTSTFHGCMFSIIHNRQAVFKIKGQKTLDLMRRFGLEGRMYQDDMNQDTFSATMKQPLDCEILDYKKRNFTAKSGGWLDAAIEHAVNGGDCRAD